jgi:hypothetical protein
VKRLEEGAGQGLIDRVDDDLNVRLQESPALLRK